MSGFEKFWQAYPKSRRVGKQKAIKAFDRAIKSKITTLDAILSKLEQLKKSIQWTKDNGAYIPHPTTWLNRGGWDDEVELDEQERPRREITDIKQCPKCGSFEIKRKHDYGICNYCGCGFHWNYKAEKWEEEKE